MALEKFSYLKSINADYIDELFSRYGQDPDSIDPSWRYFFEGLELGETGASEAKANGHANGNAKSSASPATSAPAGVDLGAEARVAELILAYREYGRFLAGIDPLSAPPASHPLLELARFGLTNADLTKTFQSAKLVGLTPAPLSDIIARMKATYCGSIAAETAHVGDLVERDWLQKKMEGTQNRPALNAATKRLILQRLTDSETFERFLHTRYVAQKRFSVEGAESVIPMLDSIIEAGADLGAKEVVLGMAHRGRLNVLVNLFGKKPEFIFTEFEGAYRPDISNGEGDVKYHMGFSSDLKTRNGLPMHLSMGSNPSHLEFINPVIEGVARAKQAFLSDQSRTQVIPIQIHGDAAFAGQGVCYETLGMSQLRGYGTGGSIHIVINNQVGFTTSPIDSRSSTYCTDVAKMLDAPIFHVNGDDPEAVWHIAKLCTEYRQKFHKDAFIDLVCYRRHGHNEGDEPSFTQPLLYKKIKAHASTRELYAQKLDQAQTISAADSQAMVDVITAKLAEAQARTRAEPPQPYVSVFDGRWKGFHRANEEDLFKPVNTAVQAQTLRDISERINHVPAGFTMHPKLARFFEARMKAVQDGKGIDWGNAEALAYATLVNEGHAVRLSGQDAERGTFTHRHSVLNDFETGQTYTPIAKVREGQAPFNVYNSHLSETAVLGFEYGYSLADPNTLVLWEAQFGDFANGAQVIIDQFLATGESKWQRMSGLTLLLPHSYEGQGPEHSSARLERFLQLCGRGNLIVANFTTPAQLFHAFRRQMKRTFRKPLIIMSPKSLLRNAQCISTLDDLSQGQFNEVLDDAEFSAPAKASAVKRVILCTGKVYYDLLAARTEKKRADVAIVRLEQLYPFPAAKLEAILKRYSRAKSVAWVQEEPRNMGAWSYVCNQWMGGYDRFGDRLELKTIDYIGRELAAAPAVGSHKMHEIEQHALLDRAMTD